MRAGELRHRVQIHTATEAADDFGQLIKTWSLSKTVWACVKNISGDESESGGKTEGREVYEIKMRYTSLAKTARLVWNGLNLEIFEIKNTIGINRELKIKASVNA